MQIEIPQKCDGDGHHHGPRAAPPPRPNARERVNAPPTHRPAGSAAPPPAWAHVPPSHAHGSPVPGDGRGQLLPRKYQQNRRYEARAPRHLPPLAAIGAALLLRGSPVGQSATCFTFLSSYACRLLRSLLSPPVPPLFLSDHHCRLLHGRRSKPSPSCVTSARRCRRSHLKRRSPQLYELVLVPDLPPAVCFCCCLPPESPRWLRSSVLAAPLGSRAPIAVRLKVCAGK